MEWLNYHHLLYFWMVAREGSITRAGEILHLAQPTLSSQIRKLEQVVGTPLFHRSGRSLTLTETGQTVFQYADEIFSLGRELIDSVRGRCNERGLRLRVGMPDVLPKLVAYRLLQPALAMEEPVQLVSFEGKLDQLLGDLALHRLDIVLSDSPLTAASGVRAFNHLLGQSATAVFGSTNLAREYGEDFPRSLEGAPMLLPTQNTLVRRNLELWFDEQGIRPRVVHEFEDSALLKVFGQAGEGLFAVPAAIEKEVREQYNVHCLGRIEAVKESFYAISAERRLKHPAVVAICKEARNQLFGGA